MINPYTGRIVKPNGKIGKMLGGSIASSIYRKAVNAYINRVDPQHKKSRLLYDGEYHVPLHNFTGPGTRMDLKEVRDFPPYNGIDACSKTHDIQYGDIKHNQTLTKEQKAKAIMNADREAIECYNMHKNEYGYGPAKLGISGKLGVETLLSMLKGKPSTLYGGLVHHYTDKRLLASRNPEYYTDEEKKIIKILTINKNTDFTYSIQKYPSDIDINQLISVTDIGSFVNDLKRMIRKIESKNDQGIFFTDFKAGIDPKNPDKGLKWTPQQILDEKNDSTSLEDALLQQSVIKLDIVIVSVDRIIEASTFFILSSKSTGEYINVPQNFFDLFVESCIRGVKDDIEKYSLFKSIKRMWSLARLQKDIPILKKLAPAIDSNLSLLGQINADIETIILLIDKYGKSIIKLPNIQNILNGFEKRLSTIIDIDFPFEEILAKIEILKDLSLRGWGTRAEKILSSLHDQILDIINTESLEFMHSVNLWPIPKNYLP